MEQNIKHQYRNYTRNYRFKNKIAKINTISSINSNNIEIESLYTKVSNMTNKLYYAISKETVNDLLDIILRRLETN